MFSNKLVTSKHKGKVRVGELQLLFLRVVITTTTTTTTNNNNNNSNNNNNLYRGEITLHVP